MVNRSTAKGMMEWAIWLVWVVMVLGLGSGLGVMLGSMNLTAGTTATVVTGMGIILLLSWLSKVMVPLLNKTPSQGWQQWIGGVGFLVGAVNLAVAMVLLPIAIWRMLWPLQVVAWPTVGAVIGAIAALIGGLITSMVVQQESP